ncbi:MAG: hypothetical protein U0O02_04915, partial [Eubacteriales bacterium]
MRLVACEARESALTQQCRIAYCCICGLLSAGATQGELPEEQEKVPWGTTSINNAHDTQWQQKKHRNLRFGAFFIFRRFIFHFCLFCEVRIPDNASYT